MYQPPKEILDKYADLLVNFCLRNGQGIQKGDTVYVRIAESGKPLLMSLHRAILRSGGNPLIKFDADGLRRQYFDLASDEQLEFIPKAYGDGLFAQADCFIGITAPSSARELEGVEPAKIMKSQKAGLYFRKLFDDKQRKGKFFWCGALYGTPALADEVGLSPEKYWDQIIRACYLDHEDPVSLWKAMNAKIANLRDKLTSMRIQQLHVESEGTNLTVKLGSNRKWLGATGQNMPSYEVYCSPDWRSTQGLFTSNQSLYVYGNRVDNPWVRFKDGVVVESGADQGASVWQEMLATDGADKIGEFSLTDASFSRITEFMGQTLYDENVGGQFGNTHIALGLAYEQGFDGDISSMSEEDFDKIGFNKSVVHTDIVSTHPRKVTATLEDGSRKVIYDAGHFTLDL